MPAALARTEDPNALEKVSIVIPVRNRPQLIVRALESVKAQSWRPLEVIVVDNDSSDHTRQAVSDWIERNADGQDFCVALLEEKKAGAAAARNRGFAAASAKYVIFFDSDDEMMPRLVERAIETVGDADIVYWKGKISDLDGSHRLKPFYSGDLIMRQIYNCPLSTQLFMTRTDFMRKAGAWNDSLLGWDDWELGLRLLLHGASAVRLSEVLTLIHAQKESITGTDYLSKADVWEHAIDVMENDIKESERTDKIRLLDMLDYRRALLAAAYRREGDAQRADRLLKEALECRPRKWWRKRLLSILHYYSAIGGRAAYLLWRH